MEGNPGSNSGLNPQGGLLAVNSSPYKAKRTASYKNREAAAAGTSKDASSSTAPKVATENREGCLKCNLL
jgi:hypothetical protein